MEFDTGVEPNLFWLYFALFQTVMPLLATFNPHWQHLAPFGPICFFPVLPNFALLPQLALFTPITYSTRLKSKVFSLEMLCKFCIKKFQQKIGVQKNFGSEKKYLSENKLLGLKKFWVRKNFGSKIFLEAKRFMV